MTRIPTTRRRGVNVRAGAVREARQAAGLTLAALSEGHVSRQALHQVETGRARPTMPLLNVIAARTGHPLDFFLADPPAAPEGTLEELERRFLTRDLEGAVTLGVKLLDERLTLEEEAAVRFWVGAAEVGRGRAEAALSHLGRCGELCAQLGDRWLAVEASDWTACALHLKDAPGAMACAEQALAECRALSPVPRATETRILGHIAAICVARQEWRRAVAAYEAALEASSTLRDLRQVAMMHHNLSIAYQRLGYATRASESAQRALAIYSLQNDAEARLRMQSDFGDLLLRQGQVDAAAEQLSAALAGFDALGSERRGRNFTVLGLAEVALLRGDWREAARRLEEAEQGAALAGEALAAACGRQLRGRLAAVTEDWELMDGEYAAAIAEFERLGMPDRVAAAHFEYGEALEGMGRLPEALAHLKAAAGRPAPRDEVAESSA